ncbi:hypothetical protein OQA88_2855 [Cercophora sp. LCS_1]
MYFSHARTTTFTSQLLTLLSTPSSPFSQIDIFLIPSFTSLVPVISQVRSSPPNTPASNLIIGAQNCSPHNTGPYTGETSPAVLSEIGVGMVEIGHAERRKLYGETDDTTAEKARAVVRNGMVPLVCVGEVERMDVEKAAEEVIRQVGRCLEGVQGDVVIAYEPVWAIGKSEPAGVEHVVGVVQRLRGSEDFKARRGSTRVVYGGSAGPGLWEGVGGAVDGLFLGRFAHEVEGFWRTIGEVAGVQPE